METVLASLALQTAGSIYAMLMQQGKEKEARAIMAQAKAGLDGLTPAKLDDIVAGVVGPTELSKIKTNPEFQRAQQETLASFKGIISGGGMDVRDQANLASIRNQTATNASHQNAQITEAMARRGIGGSGAELALRQAANQDATARESQADLDVAAQARQRYLDAIRGQGEFATQLRSQEYGEKSAAARAQDQINQFNVQNQQNVQMQNNQLHQQDFQNRQGLWDRQYRVASDSAAALRNQGHEQARMIGGISDAIGGAGMQYGAGSFGSTGGSAPSYTTPDINMAPKRLEDTDPTGANKTASANPDETDDDKKYKAYKVGGY